MPSDRSLNSTDLTAAIDANRVIWKRHVVRRMEEREIKRVDVLNVIQSGERIEDYPDDYPYPSALFFGWIEERPLHVVAAFDAEQRRAIIITAYEPDLEHFELDYRTRRSP